VQPPSADDLLQEQKRRMAVEEQRMESVVADSVKQAGRILNSDPDAAQDILKRTLASVRDIPDRGDRTRESLLERVESSLRNVNLQAGKIKILQDEALRVVAA